MHITYTIENLPSIAQALLTHYPQTQIMTLKGTLGAGKTTLVQALLRNQGVTGIITSPTFTYLNSYETNNHTIIHHFDCYRITSLDQFIDAGFYEYLYAPNSICIIEWPEIIMPLLTHNICEIMIDYASCEQRTLTAVWHGEN